MRRVAGGLWRIPFTRLVAARRWGRAQPRTAMLAGLAAVGAFASAGCQPPAERVVDRLPEPLVRSPHEARPAPPRGPIERPRADRDERSEEQRWLPPGGLSSRWKYVVIHHSADDRSTPAGMDAWHRQRGWDELGYHFVIGNGTNYPDGQVFVGPRWTKQKHGAHARVGNSPDNRWNEHGIGICLVGNFDRHPPSEKQLAALTRLVAFLCSRCHVPVERIYSHGSVDPGTRCPGRYFSLATIKQRVTAALRVQPMQVRAASQ